MRLVSSARSPCVWINSHEVVNADKSHYSEAQWIHFSASLKQTREEEDKKGCRCGGGTHQTPLESWMSNFLSPMTLTIALLLMLPPPTRPTLSEWIGLRGKRSCRDISLSCRITFRSSLWMDIYANIAKIGQFSASQAFPQIHTRSQYNAVLQGVQRFVCQLWLLICL